MAAKARVKKHRKGKPVQSRSRISAARRSSSTETPPSTSIDSELLELTRLAVEFRDERDWKQFHNPKDMALSLVLEATEVLELMQWKNGDALQHHLRARREDLGDEISDVLYWILTIAHDFDIDVSTAFRNKLIKSASKYPIEKSRGRSDKYTEL